MTPAEHATSEIQAAVHDFCQRLAAISEIDQVGAIAVLTMAARMSAGIERGETPQPMLDGFVAYVRGKFFEIEMLDVAFRCRFHLADFRDGEPFWSLTPLGRSEAEELVREAKIGEAGGT